MATLTMAWGLEQDIYGAFQPKPFYVSFENSMTLDMDHPRYFLGGNVIFSL